MSLYRQDFWSHSFDDWMSSFKVTVYAMYKLSAAFIPSNDRKWFRAGINLSSGIKREPQLAP